jgi:hypothetical protein
MKEHLFIFSATDVWHLGKVRCHPDLLATQSGGQVWLRGVPFGKKLDIALRQLPVKESYVLDGEGRLFPRGGQTPVGRIPDLDWVKIADFLSIEIPASAFPAEVNQQCQMAIIPSDIPRKGEALLVDWAAWAAYAEAAPSIRLSKLRFAASSQGKALILGDPLPPIPGEEYWLEQRVLMPSGFDFSLPIARYLLPARLDPSGDSLLLFYKNSEYDLVHYSYIQSAKRISIRLTNPSNG